MNFTGVFIPIDRVNDANVAANNPPFDQLGQVFTTPVYDQSDMQVGCWASVFNAHMTSMQLETLQALIPAFNAILFDYDVVPDAFFAGRKWKTDISIF